MRSLLENKTTTKTTGMNVIFASSEAAPFAKTGGLADVAMLLPAAIKRRGCEVSLFLPYYAQVKASGVKPVRVPVSIHLPSGKRELTAELYMTEGFGGVNVYFIKRDEFFDRAFLYGTPKGDYPDNLERFSFFSRAVIEAIKAVGLMPDVIHCNDWQTGLIPAYLKDVYWNDPVFFNAAIVFTIHNIAYQGLFDKRLYGATGLSTSLFTADGLEFWDKISLLKAGIVYSDMITTVSQTYAKEIQTLELGGGLDGLLRARRGGLFGVLNGVDYGEWNPETDGLIPAAYSSTDMSGKAKCKMALMKEFGVKLKTPAPLVGMVSRLAEQKGFDILLEALPEIMKNDIGLVILGEGETRYQEALIEAAKIHPGRVSVKIAFSNALAHLITAGSDVFLMPSRYEPCGLNQMFALRYGTPPVVRATGGLQDTVSDAADGSATGFKFRGYSASALVGKLKEAEAGYKDKKAWALLQKNGMKKDFSWDVSARRYIELYGAALKKSA
ncbi:MAG: glycogen synthase GlgA [Deltaproteobacteria bacterium]|nr:glycogen synthase GlgA [Deltaproteobacteria bacterium]